MARTKETVQNRFAEAVQELGIEQAELCLKMIKKYANKKSPETDPNLKAEERTNEPPNTTPTE